MRDVLVRRDDNWKKLQQYVLDEREEIDLRGPGRVPIWGERREYTWYIRDGFFVRSPLKFNGVQISEPERRKYEADYLRRVQARDKRGDRSQAGAELAAADTPRDLDGLIRQSREPQFISSAYFLRFKFEEGKYALVGHETVNGRDTLRIEYYPAKMFGGTDRRRSSDGPTGADKARDAEFQRLMNKVSLVTLVGRAHRASNHQVHLRQRRARFPAGAVAGPDQRRQGVDDDDAAVSRGMAAERPQRLAGADTGGRRVRHALRPGIPRLPSARRHQQSRRQITVTPWAMLVVALLLAPAAGGSTARSQTETIAAIQVHGNTTTPDEEIRNLAGIQIGMPLEATTVDDVAARLRASKRFEHVEVLKRFASIADPTQIVLVVIVDEGAVHIEMTGDDDHPVRAVKSRGPKLLFLPILSFEDGYGFTYGAQFARPDPLGAHSRLSFPLTWGGEKQAAIELDKTLDRGPFDRITGGAAVTGRTNPFYEQDDNRGHLWARGERTLIPHLRVGVDGGWQHVSFGALTSDYGDAGADVILGHAARSDARAERGLHEGAVESSGFWRESGRPRRPRLSSASSARASWRFARNRSPPIRRCRHTCSRFSAAWRTCEASRRVRQWVTISWH